MKRRLFAHERELRSWRSLTLTTHRVIHLEMWHGFECSTSILLPHLQWTRIARSHRPNLLILAGLLVLLSMLAFGQGSKELGGILLVVAGVVGLVYLSTRRASLVLASGDGRVELLVAPSEQDRQQARDFLDAIEDAAGRVGPLGQISVSV
jgi:hypothetical protein